MGPELLNVWYVHSDRKDALRYFMLQFGTITFTRYPDSADQIMPSEWIWNGFWTWYTCWWPFTSVTWFVTSVGPGHYRVIFPLWIPAFLSALPPGYLMLPYCRRRRRLRAGLCVKCGYSLKGLSEPRCPECATPFEHLS